MIIKPPITLDTGKIFSPDGKPHYWEKTNGYDSNGRRITNLVGHNGYQFIKVCPNCECEKPETEFGYDGRDTGEPNRRDQSWCSKCR